MMTSSRGRPPARTALPAGFCAAALSFCLGLERAICCDVSRHGPSSPVVWGWSGGPRPWSIRVEEIKKGHAMCAPFFLGCVRGTPPPRTHLTQRCYYDNVLGSGAAHRDFPLLLCLGQFVAPFISRGPDLRQEVLLSVTVENQFGGLWRL
jgi:hypothetical protein